MNQLIVNADTGKSTISRHIYGHFAEHLGRCIYGGFWVGEESTIPHTHEEFTMPGLSATASRDTAGVVHLSLCNVNPHQDAELMCELRGVELSTVRGRVLTAGDMTAHNTFDEPARVCPSEFHGATITGNQLKLTVPAKAVVALELNAVA